jgi:periplasmic copper chaperone A
MRIVHFAAIALLLIVGSSGQLRAQATQGKTVTVADVWARATPKGSTTAVIYMTVINDRQDADQLLGATTPMAEKVQFHSNANENGVMKMRELTSIEIEAGKKVVLKPAGTHAMLIGLKQSLFAGQSFPLTLEFGKAGKIDVIVSVEKVGAMEYQHMNGM